jgi:hypothetical protein
MVYGYSRLCKTGGRAADFSFIDGLHSIDEGGHQRI